MRTVALRACPVCGAATADATPLDLGAGADAHRRCRSCSALLATRFGDPEEVFTDGYFDAGGPTGVDIAHPRMQAALAEIGAARVEAVERVAGRPPGRWLDVGCGSGELLAVAARAGWDAVGAEPMAEAATRARDDRGLDVRAALLEDAGLEPGSFDVVSAFHVLEHQEDGRAFLRSLVAMARPGGHVVVEVPNAWSVLRERAGDRWIHLRPLEHLVQHTPSSLRRVLGSAGLEVVALRSPSWLVSGHTLDEAVANLGLGLRARGALRTGSPSREVLPGVRAPVPAAGPAGAVLRAVDAARDRRSRGMVLLAIARVPPTANGAVVPATSP